MKTLQNVIKFVELKKFKSVREFEKAAGLSNGTINNCKAQNVELSTKNIEKIVGKFSTELIAFGFSIADLASVGGEGKIIMNQEEKANVIKNGISFIGEIKILHEPSIPYERNLPAIEVYDLAGKKLIIAPNDNNQIQKLNGLLAAKEERLKGSELRADKAEQRAARAEQENDRLLSMLESLTPLLQITKRNDDKLEKPKTDPDVQP